MAPSFLSFFKGKSARAEERYKRGNALNGLGQWQAAVLEYDQAIALDASHANAYCNRGTALQHLGLREEALASYHRAMALNPKDFLAFYNSGSLLRDMRRLDAALVNYDRCLALRPDYVEAHINCGNVLQELKRHEAAVACYDRAIELGSLHAEAFQNRGFSLAQLRQFEAAVASYDRAIELNSGYAQAFQGRLYALVNLGKFEAAVETYNRALALNPDQRYLAGMRLHAKMQICDWDDLALQLVSVMEGLRDGKPLSPPFPLLSAVDLPPLHRMAAELWVRDQCPADPALGPIAKRPRREKIRIGYFSADFRSHAVSQSTAELFEIHDRARFEIIGFAFGPRVNDPVRRRLEQAFDRFIDVRDQSDVEVAELARTIGIDIAVDLGGFTEYCRTKIFALRAAPVQINYLGYPGTMGAPYMDYLIADQTVVPLDDLNHYREKIVYLPNSYLPHDSTSEIAGRLFTRAELGLPPQGFVFCCFNKKYKITPATFGSWMRILDRTEGSVLWLSQDNEEAVKNLRLHAASCGIDANRLIIAERVESLAEHLARQRVADLFLDTLPYNAHATAVDALWAGVPVLTLMGKTFASRVSASLLTSIGLPELIVHTTEEYERLAIELAHDSERLNACKRNLEHNRLRMPLFDTRQFTVNLEKAYAMIHETHLAGLAPVHIQVAGGKVGSV
jgi:predicted O-linked N-acetylglucosamine transferase (SPINDLY family)